MVRARRSLRVSQGGSGLCAGVGLACTQRRPAHSAGQAFNPKMSVAIFRLVIFKYA